MLVVVKNVCASVFTELCRIGRTLSYAVHKYAIVFQDSAGRKRIWKNVVDGMDKK